MEKYFKDIFNGAIALLQGMSITLKTMFGVLAKDEATTVQYPEETLDLDHTFGYVQAQFDDDGYSNCTTCMGCIRACPPGCITLTRGKHPENPKQKIAITYTLDYAKCEFCNLCVEACNDDAIFMAPIHEFPFFDRSKMNVEMVTDMKKGNDLKELSDQEIKDMEAKMKRLF
ncbi:MAG: 4Fe-4S dicluster domain-containing protein [Candidatus Cloacimonetes bacterium]|nr:4Fe-4S dicluster domain-containing protein [Candidatus Cloacimonadota bacterium]